MVNSSVYEKVTYKQIDDMKHAIGFDNQKVRGTKYRKYEPYRNYYDASPRDSGLGTACFNRISNEKRRALVSRFR